MKIAIFSPTITPRQSYIYTQIFKDWLSLEPVFHRDIPSFEESAQPKVNHSNEYVRTEAIHIPLHDYWQSGVINKKDLTVKKVGDKPAFFFRRTPNADLSFDLFALAFFLVSRQEEYGTAGRDRHHRFPATESLAFKKDFLHLPLTDLWVNRLAELLHGKFPRLPLKRWTYRFEPTYDVDYAWAYRYRSWPRLAAGFGKDLLKGRLKIIQEKTRVLAGRQADPFFVFPYLDQLHQAHNLRPAYFFLLADWSRYDRNVSWKNVAMQELVRNIASGNASVGIHPSYHSCSSATLVQKEKRRLEVILGRKVSCSRQHFLRIQLPETYRILEQAGITNDYTMGYPGFAGFRASTARSFRWYDLESERPGDLIIHPFQVMDGTLKHYRQYPPEKAVEAVAELVREVRQTGGVFRTIWHNSSFSYLGGWQGWKGVYEAVLKMASNRG